MKHERTQSARKECHTHAKLKDTTKTHDDDTILDNKTIVAKMTWLRPFGCYRPTEHRTRVEADEKSKKKVKKHEKKMNDRQSKQ